MAHGSMGSFMLNTWTGKFLRNVYGFVTEQEFGEMRKNQEREELYIIPDLKEDVKRRKLE
jgi:hypothetical protein